MGGKKRSRDDSYEHIMRKIRKLEKKVKRKKRIELSSSSECDDSPSRNSVNSYNEQDYPDDVPTDEMDDEVQILGAWPNGASTATSPSAAAPITAAPAPQSAAAPPPPVTTRHGEAQQPSEVQTEVNTISDDLDQEILDILGEDPNTEKSFGEDLHKDIALRWKNILLNGLNKETRIGLLKTYLPAENCSNMRAPKLNPEIKAALTESNSKKDAYSQSKQNQLTSCLSAIGRALNITLEKNANIPQEIIKSLSDAGRLLCDYHHKESLSRRYSAMNTLTKQTKDIIKNTKIDEYLFGSDLAEQLKSSKAISKSGLEMRPPVAGPSGVKNKPMGTSSQPTVARRANTLNVRGAPRAPAAEPRANPVPRRQPAPPPQRHNASSRPTQRYRSRRR